MGRAAPFFDDGAARPAALSALTRIARETGCVVVVSSPGAARRRAAFLGAALGAENLRAAAAVAFPGSGLASPAERQVLEVLQWRFARRPDGATRRWACLDASGDLRTAYVAVARAARAAPGARVALRPRAAFDEWHRLHAVTTLLDAAAAAAPRAPPPAPARPAAFAVPVRAPPPRRRRRRWLRRARRPLAFREVRARPSRARRSASGRPRRRGRRRSSHRRGRCRLVATV